MNKKAILSILGGVAITGAVLGWLLYGGAPPVRVPAGEGEIVVHATMKNTTVSREQNGRKLWEFSVGQLTNDRKANMAYLEDIKGKVYRSDGSSMEVSAAKGSAHLKQNDFALEGNVVAIMESGGQLKADKVSYQTKSETIVAQGHVDLYKAPWHIWADEVRTTSAFEQIKLKGNAKVEKGGEE